MITKPSTFILGAGASANYGFPLGTQLIKDILNAHSKPNIYDSFFSHRPPHDMFHVNEFISALDKSAVTSIDSFLEHRKEFVEIGKFAIANVLLKCEQRSNLYNNDGDDHWYKYILNLMRTGIDDFQNNKISFITFNYDRSLEHFFYTTLMNSYGLPSDKAAEIVSKIDVIHLHGSLGALPWKSKIDTIKYGSDSPDDIYKSSLAIKIIHEEQLNSDENFLKAQRLISQCEQLFCLGFGYHDDNIRRLKLSECQQAVWGTRKGLTNLELQKIGRKIPMLVKSQSEHNCLNYIRNHFEHEIVR